jgi:lipopolysaccharide transport system permease protein
VKRQTKNIFETIRRYHELIFFLVYREIRVRYKQTLLGVTWAVLQPVLQMAVFTFVFSKLGKMSTGDIPYPVFVLSGLVPWALFSGALTRGVPIIVSYPTLVTKIYFPREIFPIFATLGLSLDFLCSFAVLMVFFALFAVPFHAGILASFLLVAAIMIFAMGVLFFASTINVFFRDAAYAVQLITQIWFFMTPVVYPLSKVPGTLRFCYDLNPMVGLIESYRSLLLDGTLAQPDLLLKALLVSAAAFMLGYRFLKKYEMKLADAI